MTNTEITLELSTLRNFINTYGQKGFIDMNWALKAVDNIESHMEELNAKTITNS